jgi:hypothetical protein
MLEVSTKQRLHMIKDTTIELNGKKYVEYDETKKDLQPAVDVDHIIVIAQRGWIIEGYKDKAVTDKIQLLNANVVRSWSNGKGIGGLCNKSLKSGYKLDPIGTVSFPNEGVIAVVDIVEW